MNWTREQFEQARALLAVYVDDEPCQLDHHGTCQAHLAMLGDRCANAEAKKLLNDEPPAAPAPYVPTRRLRACVEQWPDAEEGAYNPACCRWPKSCSALCYDPATVSDDDLEPL